MLQHKLENLAANSSDLILAETWYNNKPIHLPFRVYNPNYPKEEITRRHLATHTSTILDSDYYNEKAYILKEAIEVPDSIMAMSETFKVRN